MTNKGRQPDFNYLADKYKLERGRLETAYRDADYKSNPIVQRPVPEQRKALKAVQNHSRKLFEALSKLGDGEKIGMTAFFFKGRELVVRAILERDHKEKSLVDQGMLEVKIIEDMAEYAQGRIKGGKRRDFAIRNFVFDMANFWYEETGKEPDCYNLGNSSQQEGKFYRFILDCSKYTEKQGSTIRDIVRGWKKLRLNKPEVEETESNSINKLLRNWKSSNRIPTK